MKKNLKRNIVMAAVLLFVCTAVYLNWSYNHRQGSPDAAMVKAEDEAMEAARTLEDDALETLAAEEEQRSETAPAYFASARLTRQQSRDEALSLLETAAAGEGASQETIDAAMESITTMATWSLQETQVENLLLAKDFDDCMVFMTGDGVTVAVPAPPEGLSAAAVARITDIITGETDFAASQLKIIEVRDSD